MQWSACAQWLLPWGMTQYQDPMGHSVFSPMPPSPVYSQASLVHSAPPTLDQGSTSVVFPSVINVVTLYSAVDLSTTELWHSLSWGCCFPSCCCFSEGSGLPRHNGCHPLEDWSAPGSVQLLSPLSPKPSVPSLPSGVSSPFCSCLSRNPG